MADPERLEGGLGGLVGLVEFEGLPTNNRILMRILRGLPLHFSSQETPIASFLNEVTSRSPRDSEGRGLLIQHTGDARVRHAHILILRVVEIE